MRRSRAAHAVAWGLAAASLAVTPAAASEAPADTAVDARVIVERSIRAQYYPGRDMRARVRMEIEETDGSKKYRLMTVLRLNLADGDQRYLLYFHEPGDVRRMTCMVQKHAGRDDDRMIFVPLANRIRRITAPERSRFLGSDFVREEFSGRDAAADSHTILRTETLDGRSCWVIESIPRPRTAEYARCTSWIDRATDLPVRQEFRDEAGRLQRVYTADRIERVRGAGGARHATVRVRTMTDGSGSHSTRLIYESVAYDTGLKESDFSEEHMRMQVSDWLSGAYRDAEAGGARRSSPRAGAGGVDSGGHVPSRESELPRRSR